ncbi:MULTISPECIES: transglycosylase domain-containing protein [Actinoalloteichus]|uniref:Membrane carboxypeptidase (Penicillin-binding protein) n=1 Tax=Actinoalloteichus fjordicus TaxID=1612552 RepID=A0AAC9LE47_9PSEU|nr:MULTISPECIES: transglycosylase domain-containing protein [Actinoalloteichus]APU16278.1 membrane carboxypeptidase (penicillin-binding protein) [Actinoalloteichus fjordicus]APU22338.1 membrane carboxypeptidase (penicillin-binding protein) [Actinoalloteichus sp. GBA129-24]
MPAVFLARAKGLSKLLGLCLIAGVLVAAVLFPVAAGFGAVSNQAAETVNNTSAEFEERMPATISTITDMHDTPIAHLYHQNRVIVPPEAISEEMKAAIVAVEDHRFEDHEGVDWQATIRVALQNQMAGDVQGGGSTLTQQYVKNYLAFVVADGDSEDPEFQAATETTIARKLREARIALDIEERMTKDEILAGYLNVVPYGNEIFGVHQAADAYFDTTPDQLNVAQSALLAAIVNQPSTLNPIRRPEQAIERRNLVIQLMADQGRFSEDGAEANQEIGDEIKQEPLGVLNPLNQTSHGCVPAREGTVNGFFCSYVINYLLSHGFDLEEIKRGGYTIKTTLDPRATELAKQAAENHVPKNADGIANVMAIVEPGTESHKVRALVANRDYGLDSEQFQTTIDLPSYVTTFGAGSIYKVFTAAAALENGYNINQTLDVPDVYTSPVYRGDGGPYQVRNSGNGYPETMSFTEALATSPNTPFLPMQEAVGVGSVVNMASSLGLRRGMNEVNLSGTAIQPDSDNGMLNRSQGEAVTQGNQGSFTLGAGPTSVLELANVSATLVSGGVWCPPSPIEEIRDRNGEVVPIDEAPCEQAVDEGLANSMAQAMSRDTTGSGTAANAASAAGWSRPMVGKTGTTQNYRSAAFMGATPHWAGANMVFGDSSRPGPICNGTPPVQCGSGNMYGGHAPARTWFQTMTPLHEGLPDAPLPAADPRYS